jgi:hypothetical protein
MKLIALKLAISYKNAPTKKIFNTNATKLALEAYALMKAYGVKI